MSFRLLFASALLLAASFASEPASARRGGGICFYEHAGFAGAQFCVGPGERIGNLQGPWNDRISSAVIPPGVRVTVCEHAGFGGRCLGLDRSVRNFAEIGFNDSVSSLSVEGGGRGDRGYGERRGRGYDDDGFDERPRRRDRGWDDGYRRY